MNHYVLQRENDEFRGTGGVSPENAVMGFRPAFFDGESRTIYPSRYADGRPAPIHLLDGLPPDVVTKRTPDGRVATVKHTIVAGFVLAGAFYTRDDVARRVRELD